MGCKGAVQATGAAAGSMHDAGGSAGWRAACSARWPVAGRGGSGPTTLCLPLRPAPQTPTSTALTSGLWAARCARTTRRTARSSGCAAAARSGCGSGWTPSTWRRRRRRLEARVRTGLGALAHPLAPSEAACAFGSPVCAASCVQVPRQATHALRRVAPSSPFSFACRRRACGGGTRAPRALPLPPGAALFGGGAAGRRHRHRRQPGRLHAPVKHARAVLSRDLTFGLNASSGMSTVYCIADAMPVNR